MAKDDMESIDGNPLLECCAPVFSLLLPLKTKKIAETVTNNLREKVIESLGNMEKMAYEKSIDSTEIQNARWVMTAFADELIMKCAWSGSKEWMSRPLQLELYGENSGGTAFFERLEKLRKSGVKNNNLLEIYYLCLQMGFEGNYCFDGLEKLMALQVDIRSELEDRKGKVDRRLSREGVPKDGIVMKVSRHFPAWAICSLTGAIMMLMYFGYSWVIHKEAENSINYIEKQAVILKVLLAEEQVEK